MSTTIGSTHQELNAFEDTLLRLESVQKLPGFSFGHLRVGVSAGSLSPIR